jgi:hypothetical protein
MTLAAVFGDDETMWGGRQVELGVIRVRKPGGGGLVDSIAMAPVSAKPTRAKPEVGDIDDSAPF